jgi:DNA-binding transcriptional regulator YiaG
MKKILEKYIFNGFGFPVVLRDVKLKETPDGEPYPDLNMNWLEEMTAKALIKESAPLSGAKLRFLRKFLDKSLRDLAQELAVPHTSIKHWEDRPKEKTGLSPAHEKQIKYLTFLDIQAREQRQLSKLIFADEPTAYDVNKPLEINDQQISA